LEDLHVLQYKSPISSIRRSGEPKAAAFRTINTESIGPKQLLQKYPSDIVRFAKRAALREAEMKALPGIDRQDLWQSHVWFQCHFGGSLRSFVFERSA
jgi:hypothetical protein